MRNDFHLIKLWWATQFLLPSWILRPYLSNVTVRKLLDMTAWPPHWATVQWCRSWQGVTTHCHCVTTWCRAALWSVGLMTQSLCENVSCSGEWGGPQESVFPGYVWLCWVQVVGYFIFPLLVCLLRLCKLEQEEGHHLHHSQRQTNRRQSSRLQVTEQSKDFSHQPRELSCHNLPGTFSRPCPSHPHRQKVSLTSTTWTPSASPALPPPYNVGKKHLMMRLWVG